MHSSIEGHLGCLQLGAVMNKTAVNIQIQLCVYVCVCVRERESIWEHALSFSLG